MAEAGPGPSSMASSPVVPGSAKQLRVKRRVVNLVNPADPVEFSVQSMSYDESTDKENMPIEPIHPVRRERETTPSPRMSVQSYTPLGIGKDGVRGILRQTGTPGSGNGVRFFPKNKFRVITPNQSLNPPPPSEDVPAPQPPASPRNGSFLAQLLAVTMPSMSHRRPPVSPVQPEESEEQIEPDESWEVPGQEGEVSLVASSVASERSMAISEQEDEVEPWAGTPQIHSSPLGLPTIMSDASIDKSQELELPSRDIHLPADMSDLLTQRLDRHSDIDSFSISDFSRTHVKPNTRSPEPESSLRPGAFPPRYDRSLAVSQADMTGMSSFASLGDKSEDNPTIRRQLSPLPARASPPAAPHTPTPPTKAFTSIFADMSAEQAEMSWPLAAPSSPIKADDGDGEETAFHSALFADMPSTTPPDMPVASKDEKVDLRGTPGDVTLYFDCTSPSPMPIVRTSATLDRGLLSTTPSPGCTPLVQPARALFDAHSAHTSALSSELELYRNLSAKLQAEVNERDGLLADLNLRVVEGEVWRVRVDELEEKVKQLKSAETFTFANTPKRANISPLTPPFAGDRTTVEQATTRDAEIRLAKALADQETLTARMTDLETAYKRRGEELDAAHAAVSKVEERERDHAVQQRRTGEELRGQLEAVTRRERTLHAQLDEAQREISTLRETRDRAEMLERRVEEQDHELKKIRDLRREDEQEIGRLAGHVDELSARVAGDDELINKLAEAETRAEEEKHIRKQVEKEVRALRREQAEQDAEIQELRRSLEQTKSDLLERLNAPSKAPEGEVARLRAESASKDLEIVTLQKRKNELKEDLEMLNIALDSKQQELELMKRKFAVRGVAGSTPLASTRKANLDTPTMGREVETPMPGRHINTRRRSSAAFITPSLGSVREHGKVLKGGHGTDLWKTSTGTAKRVMGKVDEENRPPAEEMLASTRRPSRREAMLA